MRAAQLQQVNSPYYREPSAPPRQDFMQLQPYTLPADLVRVRAASPRMVDLSSAPAMPEIGADRRAAVQIRPFRVIAAPDREAINYQPSPVVSLAQSRAGMQSISSVPPSAPDRQADVQPLDSVERTLTTLMEKAQALKTANEVYRAIVGRQSICAGVGVTVAIGAACALMPISPWISLGIGIAAIVASCCAYRAASVRRARAEKETNLCFHKGNYKAALDAIKQDEDLIKTIKGNEVLHKQLRAAKKLATS